MATLADLFLAEDLAPGSVRPRGNDSPEGAPWGVYRCAGDEQWAVVCVRDDDDWAGLRRAMGYPEWARDPAYDVFAGRDLARRLLDDRISEWTGGLAPGEVQDRCQAEGVPAGRLMRTVDQLADPHLAARPVPALLCSGTLPVLAASKQPPSETKPRAGCGLPGCASPRSRRVSRPSVAGSPPGPAAALAACRPSARTAPQSSPPEPPRPARPRLRPPPAEPACGPTVQHSLGV